MRLSPLHPSVRTLRTSLVPMLSTRKCPQGRHQHQPSAIHWCHVIPKCRPTAGAMAWRWVSVLTTSMRGRSVHKALDLCFFPTRVAFQLASFSQCLVSCRGLFCLREAVIKNIIFHVTKSTLYEDPLVKFLFVLVSKTTTLLLN